MTKKSLTEIILSQNPILVLETNKDAAIEMHLGSLEEKLTNTEIPQNKY